MAKSKVKTETETETKTEEVVQAELFDKHAGVLATLAAKQAEIASLEEEASKCVQEIHARFGAGPFEYNGQILTAVGKPKKRGDKDGPRTWYFRGRNTKVAAKVASK